MFEKNERTTGSGAAFTIHHWEKVRQLGDIALSPDGSRLAGVCSMRNLERNSTEDQLFLLDVPGGNITYLEEGASPVWCADGLRLLFESEEDGIAFIWLYDIASKEKKKLTAVYHSDYFLGHLAEKRFAVSPDGKYLAFISALPIAQPAAAPEVVVIETLLYKTKGGRMRPRFTAGEYSHIWLLPLEGGEPFMLTKGNYHDHSLCWSADSRHIAFISNRTGNPDYNHSSELWKADILTGAVEKVAGGPGTRYKPAWSPDNGHIACLVTERALSSKDSPADDTQVYITTVATGESCCLTAALDRRTDNIRWHPDSTAVYCTAGNHGATGLYKVALDGSVATVISGNCLIKEYCTGGKGSPVVFIKNEVEHPDEIFLFDESTASTRQLTDLHAGLKAQCAFTAAETFWFKSFDSTNIQGWIMRPAGFAPGIKYPLLLVVHGGPHNMFGYEFEERMQLLTAQGYGVVFFNPRGSSGYGQAFSMGTLLNWGGNDYRDIMAGMDHVIQQHSWIDDGRLGITGQSYGGFMANWAITQSNRFKAAVIDGGISNLVSFAGTSLYHLLIEAEFGKPWDNYALLWQWSPLCHVKNVKTPVLFLHGATDNEVPVQQAEEMYTALKKLGVPSAMVLYTEEGHGWRPDLKPANRTDLYQRMIQWFNTHLL